MNRRVGKRLLMVALLAAGCVVVLRRLDWAAAWATLARLGFLAPCLLVPYLGVLLCDCAGWRATFRQPSTVRARDLLRLRVGTDAIASTMPGGVAIAETLKAVVLQRKFGLSLSDATANVVISKFAMAIGQALFLVVGLALNSGFLRAHSHELIGRAGLEYFALTVALLFLLLACGAVVLIVRGRLFTRALAAVSPVVPTRWRTRLAAWGSRAEELDAAFAGVASLPATQLAASIGLFLAGWVALGLENWLILRAMSVSLPFAGAVSTEALVSLVRIAFFFIPSALGAQEASYYFLLRAYGLPDAEVVVAAFVIIKRSKELVWILIGYAALSTARLKPGAATSSATVQHRAALPERYPEAR